MSVADNITMDNMVRSWPTRLITEETIVRKTDNSDDFLEDGAEQEHWK